jgi:hypothetical protein
MGFGDNEPPAIRADPFPAQLQGSAGFNLLILTFVSWDVFKIVVEHAGQEQHIQIDATGERTECVFRPTKSAQRYSFAAQGCSKAMDGSTNFLLPYVRPPAATAATNIDSLREFLTLSGVPVTSLRDAVNGSLS